MDIKVPKLTNMLSPVRAASLAPVARWNPMTILLPLALGSREVSRL